MPLRARFSVVKDACERLISLCKRKVFTPKNMNRIGPSFFLVEFVSLWYFGTFEVIPYLWKNSGRIAVTINQVFVCFLGIEVLMNWLCVRYVSSRYDSKEFQVRLLKNEEHQDEYSDYTKSFFEETRIDQVRSRKFSASSNRSKSRSLSYFIWSTCDVCKEIRPARCHHCSLCKSCILMRDHHCFFCGNCVGYKNLRHFSIFLFWSIYASVYSFIHASVYYYIELKPRTEIPEILPFVTFLMNLFGHSEVKTGILIVIWWALGFFLAVNGYQFIDLLLQIPEGVTSYEFRTGIELDDSRTLMEKVEAIFGNYWILNFLIPVHFIFPPTVDPVNWPTISGLKRAPDEYL